MGKFLLTLVYYLILLAIIFGLVALGRKYVFSKVRVNKYVPLGISIALLIVQVFMPAILDPDIVWLSSSVLTILVATFFLWFMEIQATGGPKKKEKTIEIRPKAKPNRVKHLKNGQNNKK